MQDRAGPTPQLAPAPWSLQRGSPLCGEDEPPGDLIMAFPCIKGLKRKMEEDLVLGLLVTG